MVVAKLFPYGHPFRDEISSQLYFRIKVLTGGSISWANWWRALFAISSALRQFWNLRQNVKLRSLVLSPKCTACSSVSWSCTFAQARGGRRVSQTDSDVPLFLVWKEAWMESFALHKSNSQDHASPSWGQSEAMGPRVSEMWTCSLASEIWASPPFECELWFICTSLKSFVILCKSASKISNRNFFSLFVKCVRNFARGPQVSCGLIN